ncbi:MAG: serine hydroxymethyltransferase [Pseudomonadota bacterium]|nr:serine hydroxymethyltransferase [Pseudomonadota bacterium]
MWRNVSTLSAFDPDLAAALDAEAARQEAHIELIASENYASPRVMAAQGSLLTNKYAEGYPGRRYYGGCEHVDVAEDLAIARAKQLFGCEFANVQPHSGAQANAAVFLALLKPGETFLGMSLAHGGHLTHGAKPNFSGKNYNAVHYEIDPESGLIDYEKIAETARREQPKMLIGGFSAYSRQIDWSKMRAIADEVGAKFMVDMAHVAGLVAAGEYPSPIPHAHVVTTTTHKTLRGPRGGLILSNAGDPDLYKKLNSAVFPGTQGGPLMHVVAAKAVAFAEALQPEFKDYQVKVRANAAAMAEVVLERGYDVISGGTDNHLILVSMVGRNVTGHDAEETLGQAHITVNKNSVPNDPRPPRVTSGLRLGSPASTTRGFNEDDMRNVAHWICDVLDALDAEDTAKVDETVATVRSKVEALCSRYPVYTQTASAA